MLFVCVHEFILRLYVVEFVPRGKDICVVDYVNMLLLHICTYVQYNVHILSVYTAHLFTSLTSREH